MSILYKCTILWRNGQTSYYNCILCIFSEKNSKFFKHLIISTCSECRMESLHIFRLSFYIRQKVNKRCSRKHLHSIVATTKKQNIRLKQLHKERKIVISSMAYGEKVAGQITKNKTEYYLLEGKCVGLQSVTEKLEQKFALESRLWLYNFF